MLMAAQFLGHPNRHISVPTANHSPFHATPLQHSTPAVRRMDSSYATLGLSPVWRRLHHFLLEDKVSYKPPSFVVDAS
jgi:hypothetical protein